MLISEHVDALRREGALLAEAAGQAGPDAAVPTCPDWVVRDLVQHTGRVHRWATAYVRDGVTEQLGEDDAEAVLGPVPDDAALVDWYRDCHAALVEALDKAPADLSCWAFLAAPSPLAFWARRQAHETAVHRADADSASGPIRGYPARFAVDGIDELLAGFLARPGSRRLRTDPPRALHVHATDAGADWTVHIGPDAARVDRVPGPADCRLAGSASDLYLALWNRRGTDDLDVTGDGSVLDLWRAKATIRWS